MRKNIVLISVIFIFLISCKLESEEFYDQKTEMEEAMEFSKVLVKFYFEDDCVGFLKNTSSQIISLQGHGLLEKEQIEDKLCNSIVMAVSNSTKSFEDYLNCYSIEVFPATDVEDLSEIPNYTPTSKDFLFYGYNLLDDSLCENFIWDDMFIFLVSKVDGSWVCIGI